MSCVYCRKAGPFTDEHVLTRAFCGQGQNWTLQDIVCAKCNATFSSCEREWTNAPGEAISRITFGPLGRSRDNRSFVVHPSAHIYLTKDGDPIAYEAELRQGLEPKYRPQIIGTPGQLRALAPNKEGTSRFQMAWDAFYRKRELTVLKHSNKMRKNRYLIATLIFPRQSRTRIIKYEWNRNPTSTWLDRFPDTPPRDPFYCRASVDEFERLRIRAENVETAVEFLDSFFTKSQMQTGGSSNAPGSYIITTSAVVYVERQFRAVAKTAFNLAIRLLGRVMMESQEFDIARRYCVDGTQPDPQHPIVGVISDPIQVASLPEFIRDQNPDKHHLLLTSNAQRLVGLIRLYGGAIYRIHLGETPTAMDEFCRTVEVEYNGFGIREVH